MPDYWDGWTNKPMTREEILAQIRRLHARLRWTDNKRISPEDEMIVKQIRELSDRFNQMKENS